MGPGQGPGPGLFVPEGPAPFGPRSGPGPWAQAWAQALAHVGSYFLLASLSYLMNLFRGSYFLLASLNYLMNLFRAISY